MDVVVGGGRRRRRRRRRWRRRCRRRGRRRRRRRAPPPLRPFGGERLGADVAVVVARGPPGRQRPRPAAGENVPVKSWSVCDEVVGAAVIGGPYRV